jgi:hypothetical protein
MSVITTVYAPRFCPWEICNINYGRYKTFEFHSTFVEDIDLLGFDAVPCHWVVSRSLKECIAFVYSA